MALLHLAAEAAQSTRVHVAPAAEDARLSGGYAAMGMVEEVGIADLRFGVDIRLVVAPPQLGNGSRQQGHWSPRQPGFARHRAGAR